MDQVITEDAAILADVHIVPESAVMLSGVEQQPTLYSMMGDAARAGNIDALERLIAMRDRDLDRNREIAFRQAYAQMWPNLPQIERRGKITYKDGGGYDYAQYEDIHRIILPFLKQHGFALSFCPLEQSETGVTVEGELIWQVNGWSKKAKLWQPVRIVGKINIQQAQGLAQTYCIRYLTIALLALVLKGEDKDSRLTNKDGQVIDDDEETREWHRKLDAEIERAGNAAQEINNLAKGAEWVDQQVASMTAPGTRWHVFLAAAKTACAGAADLPDLNEFEARINKILADKGNPEVREQFLASVGEARKRLIEKARAGTDNEQTKPESGTEDSSDSGESDMESFWRGKGRDDWEAMSPNEWKDLIPKVEEGLRQLEKNDADIATFRAWLTPRSGCDFNYRVLLKHDEGMYQQIDQMFDDTSKRLGLKRVKPGAAA